MAAAPLIAFDIETVPDVKGLRALHQFPAALSDEEVVDMIKRKLRQEKGSGFFPLHLHRVAVISCVLRRFDDSLPPEEQLKIFSLPADEESFDDEANAINRFYRGIDKYQPQLVSWNGNGFDLVVLHYRAMMHRQSAPGYWQNSNDFRWNNYTNRYHERHTDLMNTLSLHQGRIAAPLNDFSMLCGLPGKIGLEGERVWEHWRQKKINAVREYCENDALLTYLLYVRYQHFRGKQQSVEEEAFVRDHLARQGGRWREFLAQWRL